MEDMRSQKVVIGVLGMGLVAVGGYALWLRMKRNTWKQIGTVSDIYIYPIKSGKYLSLQEAMATTMGLMQIRNDDHFPLRDRYEMWKRIV